MSKVVSVDKECSILQVVDSTLIAMISLAALMPNKYHEKVKVYMDRRTYNKHNQGYSYQQKLKIHYYKTKNGYERILSTRHTHRHTITESSQRDRMMVLGCASMILVIELRKMVREIQRKAAGQSQKYLLGLQIKLG